MAEVPSKTDDTRTQTITDGYFERELYVDADDAGAFLIELGEQLRSGDDVELTGEDWRIPFAYAGPVELEIEYEGDDEPELEIEIELTGRHGGDETPNVD